MFSTGAIISIILFFIIVNKISFIMESVRHILKPRTLYFILSSQNGTPCKRPKGDRRLWLIFINKLKQFVTFIMCFVAIKTFGVSIGFNKLPTYHCKKQSQYLFMIRSLIDRRKLFLSSTVNFLRTFLLAINKSLC